MNYQRRLTSCILTNYMLLILIIIGSIASAINIKIRPESCSNAMGDKGTCMFVWQCIKQDGVQIGSCVDRFLVGACCALQREEDNFVPGASGSVLKNASAPSLPPKVKPPVVHSTFVTKRPELVTSRTLTVGTSPSPTEGPKPTTIGKPFASTFMAQAATAHLVVQSTKKPLTDDFLECGIPAPFPRRRVVGGTHSSFGEWPWQVSVRTSSLFGLASTHICGGVILNANWIATAAHCLDHLLKSDIRIRVGDYDFSTVQEPAPFQERGVEKKVVHPRYNIFTYEHDLALVKLDAPLVLKAHVRPICLPSTDDTYVGRNATVTGWGRLSEGGPFPSRLQQVQVPIISNEKCREMFQTAGWHENIPDIFLCAGYEAGGREACQGDSGGPLQVKREDGRWILAGMTSWGIGCARPNTPGVSTRISKFTSWIKQQIS